MSTKKAKVLSLIFMILLLIPVIIYFSVQAKLNTLEKGLTNYLIKDGL